MLERRIVRRGAGEVQPALDAHGWMLYLYERALLSPGAPSGIVCARAVMDAQRAYHEATAPEHTGVARCERAPGHTRPRVRG